jgi:glycosyltransferase involved in cell wall biosynthesis
MRIVASQAKIAFNLARHSGDFDVVFVHSGQHWLIVPILIAKMMRKKLIIIHMGGDKLLEEQVNARLSRLGRSVISIGFLSLQNLTYSVADLIVCESQRVANLQVLLWHRSKTLVAKGGYIDTERFQVHVPIEQRTNIIAFVGAFKPVKGVSSFLKSVPLVLKSGYDAQFIIAGEGPLQSSLEYERRMLPSEVGDRLKILGWIDHESLPTFLNHVKLLVLPSFSEGVPVVIQEAMACGTAVLSTAVGGVPDLIEEGVTGFITRGNDPKTLAGNMVRVLKHSDLGSVTRRARELIEREYSRNALTQKYANILALVDPIL